MDKFTVRQRTRFRKKKHYEKCGITYDSGDSPEFPVIPISLSRIPKINIRREFGNITATPINLTAAHYCSGNWGRQDHLKCWNLSTKLHSDASHNAETLMSITLIIYLNVSVCLFLIR
jgi:hypothetical protein